MHADRPGRNSSAAPASTPAGRRLVALIGFAFVVINVPPVALVPPAPALGSGAEEILAYYRDIGDSFLIYGWLTALAIPFMLVHMAAVVAWLRRRQLTALGLAYLMCGLLTHCMGMTLVALTQVASMAALRGDAATARTLADLGNIVFCCAAVSETGRQVAGGLAIRWTGEVPRWLAWPAFGSAALCLLGSAAMISRSGTFTAGSTPAILWGVAIAATFTAVNVALLRRPPVQDGQSGSGRHRRRPGSLPEPDLRTILTPADAGLPPGGPPNGRPHNGRSHGRPDILAGFPPFDGMPPRRQPARPAEYPPGYPFDAFGGGPARRPETTSAPRR